MGEGRQSKSLYRVLQGVGVLRPMFEEFKEWVGFMLDEEVGFGC